MVSVTLLWLLLIPAALSLVSFFILPRLNSRAFSLGVKQAAIFSLLGLAVSALVMTTFFYIGISSKTGDVEVWNGSVLSKTRKHDHYVRSYDCNCREVCSGSGQNRSCSRVCDTCYEDRYTVTWSCDTTIGQYIIQHLDSDSEKVYNTPNPQRWDIIKVDDPVSKVRDYTNYVRAVPESLFRPAAAELKAKFASAIPPYPANVYDLYYVDRVIPVGVNVPDLKGWNFALQDSLKFIGPSKQVNAIIVFVNTADVNYEYALRDAWLNGKKNDVILVIGTTAYPKIDWVRVISWTERELFKVALRDEVLALGEVDRDKVLAVLNQNIQRSFERKRMRDFKYLENEIDPPLWLTITMIITIVLAYGGFWFYAWYQWRQSKNRRGWY